MYTFHAIGHWKQMAGVIRGRHVSIAHFAAPVPLLGTVDSFHRRQPQRRPCSTQYTQTGTAPAHTMLSRHCQRLELLCRQNHTSHAFKSIESLSNLPCSDHCATTGQVHIGKPFLVCHNLRLSSCFHDLKGCASRAARSPPPAMCSEASNSMLHSFPSADDSSVCRKSRLSLQDRVAGMEGSPHGAPIMDDCELVYLCPWS